MQMRRRRVIIADDHALMTDGVARILAADFDVVGIVSDGRQLLASVAALAPDIVSLDIGMPGLNGIQAAVELHRLHPRIKLIFVTQQVELPYLRAAFHAGASGYVSKQSAGSELVAALRKVISGGIYITPALAQHAAEHPEDLRPDPSSVFNDPLSPRQREVLQLIAEGKTAKEISAVLTISTKTVEFHKSCLMNELGLRTTAELTRYALNNQLVAPLGPPPTNAPDKRHPH
ncbi:response regulator [Terriglobus sp.]|uniref:response regulator n=1 Tax=Terriglobus sp. TaxID=1889013 RepID=UPI003B002B79